MNIQFLEWPVINCDQVDQLNKMDSAVLHREALLKWLIKLFFVLKTRFFGKSDTLGIFRLNFSEKERHCREHQELGRLHQG